MSMSMFILFCQHLSGNMKTKVYGEKTNTLEVWSQNTPYHPATHPELYVRHTHNGNNLQFFIYHIQPNLSFPLPCKCRNDVGTHFLSEYVYISDTFGVPYAYAPFAPQRCLDANKNQAEVP